MSVLGFDHVAITVADVERTLAFYAAALGAEPLYLELFREGRIPVAILQIGASRLSVHPAAAPALPHAAHPTPGSADLCFRWGDTIDAAIAQLEAQGISIEEGPVPRPAADGAPGQSVYFRDPDDNLVELLTTIGGDA